VINWLQARPRVPRGDPGRGDRPAAVYAKAIRTPGLLPNATLVVDHVHLVKLANDAVTKVQRRAIFEQHSRRDCKIDLAWANRRRLLTARERAPSPALSISGGPPSKPSSIPGSPTPAPKGSTGSPSR
jgi:transposase